MELQYRKNDKTGEELYYTTHSSGLGIYIIPKKDYSKTYAIFGTRYGSVDSKFVVPGENELTEVPDGIAHYLEHKMFDQPDGSNVFDKFSKYGGNANAFTSFNITAYLFAATSNIEENIETLMDYVQSPYFTEESVQKEQGIIGQEIRMYDDSGSWKLFFNFLNCLYKEHPVKKEIAGTVESISHITPEYLYKCYDTFYNLSNMSIVVVGNVDPVKISKVIENSVKKNEPFEEKIKKVYPTEPDEVAKQYAEQSLSVAMPLFMTGFKDTNNGFGGDELLKKSIETNIILKMLFGRSSKFYKSLYEKGLINNRFSLEYTMQPDYAYSSIDGESSDPKAVYEAVINEVEETRKNGLSKEDFERIKKWYDGYYLNHQHVYNPKSVIDAMQEREFQSYWISTETYEALKIYIDMNFEGLKDDVLSMIAGNAVPVNIGNFSNDMATFHSEDDVLTLLIHLGYTSYDYDSKTVKIPNEEVRAEYVNSVSASNWGEVSKSLKNSADTLEAIWQKRPKQVAEAISQAHFETSHIQYNDENALSYTISLALYSARNFYMIYRELPSGKGFADLVFLPRKKFPEKPAIVVELKWDKDVSGAIAQIKNKEYCRSLEEYRGNVLLVGVNYDKKTKVHECMIEECEIW